MYLYTCQWEWRELTELTHINQNLFQDITDEPWKVL